MTDPLSLIEHGVYWVRDNHMAIHHQITHLITHMIPLLVIYNPIASIKRDYISLYGFITFLRATPILERDDVTSHLWAIVKGFTGPPGVSTPNTIITLCLIGSLINFLWIGQLVNPYPKRSLKHLAQGYILEKFRRMSLALSIWIISLYVGHTWCQALIRAMCAIARLSEHEGAVFELVRAYRWAGFIVLLATMWPQQHGIWETILCPGTEAYDQMYERTLKVVGKKWISEWERVDNERRDSFRLKHPELEVEITDFINGDLTTAVTRYGVWGAPKKQELELPV